MPRRTFFTLMLMGSAAMVPGASFADVVTLQLPGVQADNPDDIKNLKLPPDSIVIRTVTGGVHVEQVSVGGGSTSKPTIAPLTIVKQFAASSVNLFLAAVRGKPYSRATVTFYRTDPQRGEMAYFQIDLKNAYVASQQWLGSKENAQDAGLEQIELGFDQIQIMDLDTRTGACWSVVLQKAC